MHLIEKAKAHFLGQEGHKKLNCAQCVAHVFKDQLNSDEETLKLFAGYGGGKAPEGYCGAFYAARWFLEQNKPEKIDEYRDLFIAQAGSTKCKEIRTHKKLSCVECIEKAVSYLLHTK